MKKPNQGIVDPEIKKGFNEVISLLHTQVGYIANDKTREDLISTISILEERGLEQLDVNDVNRVENALVKTKNSIKFSANNRYNDTTIVNNIYEARNQGIRTIGVIYRLFSDIPLYDDDSTIELMIDIIKKQKYENIIKLENRDDKEGILQEIEHYTHTLINIKYQEKENMISMTDKDKQKLIDELKKDFPDLAKGKFEKIKSERWLKDAKTYVKKVGLQDATFQIIDKLRNNIDQFTGTSHMLDITAQRINNVCSVDKLNEVLIFFGKRYMEEELNKSIERKTKIIYNNNKDIVRKDDKKNSPRDKGLGEKIAPKTKWHEIKDLIHRIFKDSIPGEENNKDIEKYIIRLIRNGKNVRIDDLVEKFCVDPQIFTTEIRNEAKKIGLPLVENSENRMEGSQNKVIEKNSRQKEDIGVLEPVKQDEAENIEVKVQKYLKERETMDGNTYIEILKMAGYTFTNETGFIRQFEELYPSKYTQNEAIKEIIKKINKIRRKKRGKKGKLYRCIDLTKGYRLLFLVKNKVDGIYNHKNYEKILDGTQ